MHINALHKIENEVEGSLRNCEVRRGLPKYESLAVHVQSLAAEVIKHKKEWLTISDVFSIFYDLVYEAVKATKGALDEESLRNLWGLLGEAEAQKLKKALVDFYDSIPRDYDVYIPVQSLSTEIEPVDLSERFAIVVFPEAQDVPGRYQGANTLVGPLVTSDDALEPKEAYFRYSIKGYCSRNLENLTLKKTVSNFKIAFQQGIATHLFEISEPKPAGLGLLSGLTHYQIKKAKLVCVDKSSHAQRIVSTELPIGISKLLGSIDLKPQQQFEDAVRSRNADGFLNRYFKHAALLMENTSEEAVRVRSAIEWCFDSYATENTAMSVLQTCLGLEALFGDDAEEEALGDRCTYLIGLDIKGRKVIKESFKALFTIRSRLVHGSATSLKPDEEYYLIWGREVLNGSISKEIEHLRMENL